MSDVPLNGTVSSMGGQARSSSITDTDLIRAAGLIPARVKTFFLEGREAEAVGLIMDQLARRPGNVALTITAAMLIAHHTVRYDTALALLREALEHVPDNVQAQQTYAYTLICAGQLAEGSERFGALLARYPAQRVSLIEHLSAALLQAGLLEEARQVLAGAIADRCTSAALLSNMGCALTYLNRSAESLPYYEAALRMAPGNKRMQASYGCALLKAGHLGRGWALHAQKPDGLHAEAWFKKLPPLTPQTDVRGRSVLLYHDHGLGDTLQFVRFVTALMEKGAIITLAVPATLLGLIGRSFPTVNVVDIAGMAVRAQFGGGFDYADLIMNLPYALGLDRCEASVLAPVIPYLVADEAAVAAWGARLPAGQPRIGLVWAGECRQSARGTAMDDRRSTTLQAMAPIIASRPDATFISLQYGRKREEIAQCGFALIDPMDQIRSMDDTAALVKNLDLLITVDSSPAHLAGGLACPVWVMSRQDACWRWLDSGETTAWYPTMRLFRAKERSFAPMIDEVAEALRQATRFLP